MVSERCNPFATDVYEGDNMRTTSQLRKIWAPACGRKLQVLTLHSGARISVASEAAEAFRALDTVMQAFGYLPRPGDTGAYNCRIITGGSAFSLHAYGIAADINWNSNPYRGDNVLVTDMPSAMVELIKGIRTTDGATVFRWGGDYNSVKDAMHYEVVASRSELAKGIDWNSVRQTPPDPDDPTSWPVLQLDDRRPAVEELQRRLGEAGFTVIVDGIFGTVTKELLEAYQQSRGLDVDGVSGLQTWTALLTDQPAVDSDDSPVKGSTRAPDSHPSTRPELEHGATGLDVTDLQRRLLALGLKPGKDDGMFGPVTLAAVLSYQESRSLTVDGIVGLQTWSALLQAS